MFYGFVITEAGNNLLAKMVAGDKLTITKVVMDKGTAESAEAARKLTAPIAPGPSGTSTVPTVEGAAVNMLVEYRSDLNGGLQEGFWIGGFAVFGKVENGVETMIYYGSLGERKQYVSAYVEGTAPDVRRYHVSITVTAGVEVEVSYPAEAWMTAEDVAQYISGMGLDGDGYLHGDRTISWMGQSCQTGPLSMDNIRGNTVLGGTPAYDAPVSMESVEGPLKLRVAGKNLVRPVWNLESQTQTGVTCVRNGDSFTLSGTNSGSDGINFYIQRYDTASAFSLPAGTYTLSGMPARAENKSFLLGLYHRLPGGTNEQLATDYGNPSRSKQTFTLSEATDNLFLAIVVGVGVNADGVTVTPQIEAGSEATAYEEPSNAIVEIPLLGTDGQSLEPLRMSYIGRYGDGNRVQAPDRIIRKDGVWCVERNAAVADLTAATWSTSTNYLTPNLNGDLIRGRESHWVISTHFPPAGANPSTVWTAGIWMGVGMVINKASLPNGTATTPEEMTAWCAAQAEAGTPVLVCYARTEPVYEELHQDVQVLLNTQRVPGGTCSVWFEGDVLPSAADIGLPRGDYPCSDVEGAYRWLEELSNPLPTPTITDLYAWALEQQRGGAFTTSGTVTTKNVPEAGNLTGILAVTEQGADVSMLVFGPTGKLHTAARIAGVWRGWTTLYSPLSKPTPEDLGAAAASHSHSTDQITSGILPMTRGGLGASTWSAALDNLRGLARQATYYPDSTEPDIDTLTDGVMLVSAAYSKNCPVTGPWILIIQLFYGGTDTSSQRTQLALPYRSTTTGKSNGLAVRTCASDGDGGMVWSDWEAIYTSVCPPPPMTGATASESGAAGLAPAPAAGAQTKFLRGDGTWQTPYTHPSYTARSSGLYKIAVDGTGHISGAEAIHTGRAARFVVGTSAAGWTADDCDYLCDGVSDQTEINAAIAALPSWGGEVLLLDGTYNISSSITMGKANVSLRGCGPATVLTRKFNGSSANGVIGCSAANCTISRLAIDGNKGSFPNENNRGVYASQSAADIAVEDVVVQNSRDGIYLGGMTGGRITRCRVTNSGAFGVFIYNATAIDISHNHIDATGETAVLINGGKSIKVDGNTITGSTNYGIRIFGDAVMCALSGNICLDNAGGISIEDASMCSATGNQCMRGSGSPEDYDATKVTIRVTSGSSNIIAGNLVMGKDVEDTGTGNLVVNNKFE